MDVPALMTLFSDFRDLINGETTFHRSLRNYRLKLSLFKRLAFVIIKTLRVKIFHLLNHHEEEQYG